MNTTRTDSIHRPRSTIALGLLAVGVAFTFVTSTSTSTLLAQDEALQQRINAAVKRGREQLLGQLPGLTNNPAGNYPMGRLALPLAACLKAGADPEDARVKAALRKLDGLPLKKVYSVSCYLFALDALAQRAFKKGVEDRRRGKTVVRPPSGHRADGKVRGKMKDLVDWLVAARTVGQGYWGYGHGLGHRDFSNSQFAILGLQIGLEHRIPMPRQVFEEVAQIFVKSLTTSGNPEQVRVTYSTDLKDLLKARPRKSSGSRKTTVIKKTTSGVETLRVKPGGWQYQANQQGAKASMTAAGLSSLIIVRNALGRARAGAAVERAIASSIIWTSKNFNQYMNAGGGHGGLYTMYSLEKVGDLGEIETLGGRNWYVEGANKILAAQQGNGSWGQTHNTAFALMFLTRATRLKPFAAPKITTNARGAAGKGIDPDLVYIARLEGFVSAKDIFRLLEESRDTSLVSAGREVVENYKASEKERMIPDLLRLWTKPSDRISRFARDAIEEITGLKVKDPADIQGWLTDSAEVDKLEKKPSVTAEEILVLLAKLQSPALKGRLVDLANRKRLYGIASDLVDELTNSDYKYRLKVNGVLGLWAGKTVPGPSERDHKGWKEVEERWRGWADREGDKLVTKNKVGGLIAKLDSASPKDAVRVIAQIVAVGRSAIPELESAMQRADYSFYIIEALEQLRGERIGLK